MAQHFETPNIAVSPSRSGRATWCWLAIGVVLLALIALPFVAEALGNRSFIALATRILIMGIAAASLNFALGYGGLVSFGHAAFYGLGGYTVAILSHHLTQETALFGLIPGTSQMLITLPVAMLVSGFVALIIGALSLRTSGVQFIMITLAFSQMLFFFFASLSAYGGEDGVIMRNTNDLFGLNMRDRATLYYLALFFACVAYLVYYRMIHSSFGLILDGLRQNDRRLAALGVSAYRHRLIAFVISGMGTGLAGALMANVLRFASPDMLSWHTSGQIMIMIILGGVGTIAGPFIGAAALIFFEDALASWTEHWPLALGIILLVVVLRASGGLMSLFKVLKGKRRAG